MLLKKSAVVALQGLLLVLVVAPLVFAWAVPYYTAKAIEVPLRFLAEVGRALNEWGS